MIWPSSWRSVKPRSIPGEPSAVRMKLHDAEELRQLTHEIQRLNRMVADRELQNEMRREVGSGKW
jgi:hypothetical protein